MQGGLTEGGVNTALVSEMLEELTRQPCDKTLQRRDTEGSRNYCSGQTAGGGLLTRPGNLWSCGGGWGGGGRGDEAWEDAGEGRFGCSPEALLLC